MCFGDNCAHECHCTGDMICDSSDGDCGEAECDTGSDYQYYGPPACQRVMKGLGNTAFLDKEEFIQAFLVRSQLTLGNPTYLRYRYHRNKNSLNSAIFYMSCI